MKVRTFTKKDVAVEIANRLEATLVDSLIFTDELFLVLRDMLTDDHEKVRIEIRNFGVLEVKPTKAKPNAIKKSLFLHIRKHISNQVKFLNNI